MATSTLVDKTTGLLFALLLAVFMGYAATAVLMGDFMESARVLRPQELRSVAICGYSASLAALVAWWFQRFVSERHWFGTRLFFALATLVLAFLAIGGLLVVINNYMGGGKYGSGSALGLDDIYWASLGGFYNFLLFVVAPLRPALAILFVGAALFVTILGPKRPLP